MFWDIYILYFTNFLQSPMVKKMWKLINI